MMWPSTAQRAYTPTVAQIQALSISTPKIQRFPTRKSQISSPSQRYCIDTIRQDSRTCEVCVGTHMTSVRWSPTPTRRTQERMCGPDDCVYRYTGNRHSLLVLPQKIILRRKTLLNMLEISEARV